MKKTLSNERLVYAFNTVANGSRSKMEAADRRALHKILFAMKDAASEFERYRDDAINTIRPDNYQEVEEIIKQLDAKDDAKRKAALLSDPKFSDALSADSEYKRELDKCLREVLDKEVQIDIEPLRAETFDRLLDSNPDWTIGIDMELRTIFCE